MRRNQLAAAWAALFAAPHVAWGLGSDLGLRTSLADELVDGADLTFRLGCLAIAVFCLAGSAVALLLGARTPIPRKLLVGLTWFGAVLLLLRAGDIYVEFTLGLTGAFDIPPDRHAEYLRLARWFMFLWGPFFAVGGVLWTRAALAARRTVRSTPPVPAPVSSL